MSVHSQTDTEHARLERKRQEIDRNSEMVRAEVAGIYTARGLGPELARQVDVQLMQPNALGAFARGEPGISEVLSTNPV